MSPCGREYFLPKPSNSIHWMTHGYGAVGAKHDKCTTLCLWKSMLHFLFTLFRLLFTCSAIVLIKFQRGVKTGTVTALSVVLLCFVRQSFLEMFSGYFCLKSMTLTFMIMFLGKRFNVHWMYKSISWSCT